MSEYEFKTVPYEHQLKEFQVSRDEKCRAIFWEQGTGKSKLLIDTAAYLFESGKIDCVIVVAPSGVNFNWVTDEFPTHCPERVLQATLMRVFQSSKSGTKKHQRSMAELINHGGFSVLAVTYDGAKTKTCRELIWELLKARKVMMVADESQRIKNPTSKRTKVLTKAGSYADYRRILSGTPITQGPFDAYSQVMFLDSNFWKERELSPFSVFKAHFGVWRKQKTAAGKYFPVLSQLRRLDELASIFDQIGSRVTKDEVLDLPDKVYTRRYFEMSSEQAQAYQNLRDNFLHLLQSESGCENCQGTGWVQYHGFDGECAACAGSGSAILGMVSAPLAITRLLRLQQVLSGYTSVDFLNGEEAELTALPGTNARIDLLGEVVEDIDTQFIVFARFTEDINLILEKLDKMGVSSVRYDGLVSEDDRVENKRRFQAGEVRAFVAKPSVASTGLTLVQAKSVIYYNNSFSLEERLQSEDRAHRIGQDTKVLYIDLICKDTVDEHIREALVQKLDIASTITGDKLREWIRDE